MSEQSISPDPLAPPEIGSRLAQAREAAALSVDQVAAKLLVSASQIRALESGHMPSSYSADYYERTVRKYANFLGIEVDQAALPAAAAAVGQAHAIGQDKSPAGRLAGFTPHRVGIGGRVDMPTIDNGRNAKPWILSVAIVILALIGFQFRDQILDPTPSVDSSAESANSALPATLSPPVAPGSSSAVLNTGSPIRRPVEIAGSNGSGTSAAEGEKKAVTATGSGVSQAGVPLSGTSPAGASPVGTAQAGAAQPGAAVGAQAGASQKSAGQVNASQVGVATASSANTGAPSLPADTKSANSATPDGRVRISCATPCWVQTTASDGTRTEKIFQPGQELVMPANALASLIIGNAKSARMTVDGVDVNLNAFMKGSSDVARVSETALRELVR